MDHRDEMRRLITLVESAQKVKIPEGNDIYSDLSLRFLDAKQPEKDLQQKMTGYSDGQIQQFLAILQQEIKRKHADQPGETAKAELVKYITKELENRKKGVKMGDKIRNPNNIPPGVIDIDKGNQGFAGPNDAEGVLTTRRSRARTPAEVEKLKSRVDPKFIR